MITIPHDYNHQLEQPMTNMPINRQGRRKKAFSSFLGRVGNWDRKSQNSPITGAANAICPGYAIQI